MKLVFSVVLAGLVTTLSGAFASEYLIKFDRVSSSLENRFVARHGGSLELVSQEGAVYKWTTSKSGPVGSLMRSEFSWDSNIVHVEKNRTLKIQLSPALQENRSALLAALGTTPGTKPKVATPYPDNPEFILSGLEQTQGTDPLVQKAWGILAVDAPGAWTKTPQGKNVVVAVTDTGVDYTHQDLVNNMWKNPKEVAGDGIDNDGNGYVDDIVGWDFATNDNKPYDLTLSLIDILLSGGNPGHGTHCSGVVGASLNNSLGTAGVAPKVKIMAVRFLTEKGQGGTAEAIKAVDYAANNGANIISASWGGEADPEDPSSDKLLLEAIERAGKKGVLFIAAAGNGRPNASTGQSDGFDIDTDSKPVYPAAFNAENMIGVAAIDSQNGIAKFSNWGKKSIQLGAPGVKILSTVPGNRYQDTIVNMGSIQVTWDGTSMATPAVSGAAAVIWSQDPGLTASGVKAKLLGLTTATESLKDKVSTNGRLDLHGLR